MFPHRFQTEAGPCGAETPSRVLFAFQKPCEVKAWRIINDPVMGGLSKSEFTYLHPNLASFTGHLSTQNNGGFCSVQSPDCAGNFCGFSRLRLRLCGDGRHYAVCLHQRYMQPGTSYRLDFTTVNRQWIEIVLPFEQFVLMRYGQRAGVQPVKAEQITNISLLLADKLDGDFALQLAEVRLCC